MPEPDLVVVALSARSLVASAARGGRRAAALDLFADTDTRAFAHTCHTLPSRRLRLPGRALADVLTVFPFQGLPLVYGAGFEDRVPLLARVTRARALLGNRPETVARLKDPMGFAGLLAGLGIAHPEVAPGTPPDGGAWLRKRAGASGGAHIRAGAFGRVVPAGCYWQRRIVGEALSLMFLADGARILPVGISRQWADPAPGRPFRYGGATGPVATPAAATMAAAAARVAAAVGLVGLNSADFLVSDEAMTMLEINPRPGATLDLFDRDPMPSLLGLHIDACGGRLPDRLPMPRGGRAALVVYAREVMDVPGGMRWPDWTADRPQVPTRIPAGAPVCTVLADAQDAVAAEALARRRAAGLFTGLIAEPTREAVS